MSYAAKYWADMRNRKEYLCQFARNNLFDPLVPENWYKCNLDKLWAYKVPLYATLLLYFIITKAQGSQHLLRCYSGNFIRAIMSIFPDIGLEKTGFLVANVTFPSLSPLPLPPSPSSLPLSLSSLPPSFPSSPFPSPPSRDHSLPPSLL